MTKPIDIPAVYALVCKLTPKADKETVSKELTEWANEPKEFIGGYPKPITIAMEIADRINSALK